MPISFRVALALQVTQEPFCIGFTWMTLCTETVSWLGDQRWSYYIINWKTFAVPVVHFCSDSEFSNCEFPALSTNTKLAIISQGGASSWLIGSSISKRWMMAVEREREQSVGGGSVFFFHLFNFPFNIFSQFSVFFFYRLNTWWIGASNYI